ncbi:MAG TPA: hypothetical protein VE991_09045 [Acidimicrobiales bacterium]|nr:hypothetical protein [Acidimicrobiales bacterium]
MQLQQARVLTVLALGCSAVALGACQGPATVHGSRVSTSVSAPASALTGGGSAGTVPDAPAPPSSAQGAAGAADALDSAATTQTIDQIQSDLGGLDSALAQAGADIDNPQGDS